MIKKDKFSQYIVITLIVMIGIAFSEFILRGPVRAISHSEDLTAPFIQSRAWIKGINPYQSGLEKKLIEKDEDQIFNSGIYPPTTSAMLGVLSLLKWSYFKIAWSSISTILFFIMLLLVIDFLRFHLSLVQLLLIIFFTIAWAPFHTGIGIGQVSVPVILMCIISYLLYKKDKKVFSGILLGLGVCLKPQIAIFFSIYFILRRENKIFITSILVVLLVIILAEIPYINNDYQLGESWIWWKNRIVNGYGVSGGDRFLSIDSNRFHAINLHTLFLSFFNSNSVVNIIVMFVFSLLFMMYIYFNFVFSDEKYDLLFLSQICILMLLPVYHRFYDAGVVIIPVIWAIYEYHLGRKFESSVVLVCGCAFLFPGSAILIVLMKKGIISEWVMNFWLWNSLVMSHQVVCLLIICVTLNLYMKNTKRYLAV